MDERAWVMASHYSSTSDNHNYENASDSKWRSTPVAWGLSAEGGPRTHYEAGRDIEPSGYD